MALTLFPHRLVPGLLAGGMLAGGLLIAAFPAHGGGAPVPTAGPQAATPAGPQAAAPQPASPQAATAPQPPRPQPRPHTSRIPVDYDKVRIDDGDTVIVAWGPNDEETVRILGIDCPETRHPQHDLPYAQPFGDEARAFAMGAFATASKIELARAAMLDPYGRTLGYLFVDGRNYSLLVIAARLAEESVTQFGDNGFPQEAAQIKAAAQAAGPLPFESPWKFRQRMHDVAKWMKEKGAYPAQ